MTSPGSSRAAQGTIGCPRSSPQCVGAVALHAAGDASAASVETREGAAPGDDAVDVLEQQHFG